MREEVPVLSAAVSESPVHLSVFAFKARDKDHGSEKPIIQGSGFLIHISVGGPREDARRHNGSGQAQPEPHERIALC